MRLFLFSWLIVGLITTIGFWIYDMRGKAYDPSYFDMEGVMLSLLTTVLGYISAIVVIIFWTTSNKFITKMIWRIANIGLKK